VHNIVNFFSKIFGKSTFGTKRPERLIKDVISVREVPEKKCVLIECREPDRIKCLEFEADEPVRFKIVQKLSYLISLLEQEQQRSNN
jgi:hypothetical protein